MPHCPECQSCGSPDQQHSSSIWLCKLTFCSPPHLVDNLKNSLKESEGGLFGLFHPACIALCPTECLCHTVFSDTPLLVCVCVLCPLALGSVEHSAMEHIMASSRGRSCKMCFVVKMVVKERRGSIFKPNAFFFIFMLLLMSSLATEWFSSVVVCMSLVTVQPNKPRDDSEKHLFIGIWKPCCLLICCVTVCSWAIKTFTWRTDALKFTHSLFFW